MILEPEVQPGFGIDANLFAFANGFNPSACTGTRGTTDNGPLATTGNRADSSPDCSAHTCCFVPNNSFYRGRCDRVAAEVRSDRSRGPPPVLSTTSRILRTLLEKQFRYRQ